jgi:hypothetical protein
MLPLQPPGLRVAELDARSAGAPNSPRSLLNLGICPQHKKIPAAPWRWAGFRRSLRVDRPGILATLANLSRAGSIWLLWAEVKQGVRRRAKGRSILARCWLTVLDNYRKAPLKTTRESASAATRVRRVLIRFSRLTASSSMNDTRPRPGKSLLIDREDKQHVNPLEQITTAQACPISRHYCCQNQKKDDRELQRLR